MTEPAKPRRTPCSSCPYRQNVESGIWDASEYEKLEQYDGETYEQSPRTFGCHQGTGELCSGWLGHRDPYDLLAVRLGLAGGTIDPSAADYTTTVPLFATGREAAEHGMQDIEAPTEKAVKTIKKIVRKRGLPYAE